MNTTYLVTMYPKKVSVKFGGGRNCYRGETLTAALRTAIASTKKDFGLRFPGQATPEIIHAMIDAQEHIFACDHRGPGTYFEVKAEAEPDAGIARRFLGIKEEPQAEPGVQILYELCEKCALDAKFPEALTAAEEKRQESLKFETQRKADAEQEKQERADRIARAKAGEKMFYCENCQQVIEAEDIVEVRECPHCEEAFDGTENGRNCPSCNRPFSRLLAEEGCSECLDEAGVVPYDPVAHEEEKE